MSYNPPIQFTGHQVEITEALKTFATKKFDRLAKHFSDIVSINVTFEVEKLQQIAKATISIAGKVFHADSSSESLYNSIDTLVSKLYRQIDDHHKKHQEH